MCASLPLFDYGALLQAWQQNPAPQSKTLLAFMETDGCALLAEVERKWRAKEREEKGTHQDWKEPEGWEKTEVMWAEQEVAAITDDARFLILLRIAGGASQLSPAMMLALFTYTYELGWHCITYVLVKNTRPIHKLNEHNIPYPIHKHTLICLLLSHVGCGFDTHCMISHIHS